MMWTAFLRWLRNAPIADPVDRRNAPILQSLFLLLGLSIPASWTYFLATGGDPTGGRTLMLLAMGMAALALVCVAMIRRGRFRAAVMLYLCALLTMQGVNHLLMGFQALAMNQIDQFLMLIIGGLVLGRRALWVIFIALLAVAASGFAVDAYRLMAAGKPVAVAYSHLFSVLFGYLLVTLVLDRTITALRESLDESNARGRELQHEMAERERTQSQLIQAQKLEASGRLASGISHDFSNILAVILGFSAHRHRVQDMDSHAEKLAALDEALQGVEEAAGRGMTITRKLLSFSRNDALKIETFDAVQAFVEMRSMLRQLFPPGVQIKLAGDARPLPVRLDRSEFELMILNIAANARDAMPETGIFEVSLSPIGNDLVEIALADNGQGMDETVRLRIFEPFFSTKTAKGGTGLGLSVVHDLVKVVGGDIAVESTPGLGSVFRIHLPLAQASTTGPVTTG
ncbi:sensor histidine kinase [Lysobacter cavernae]|uniref:histidine kinase n=1 Tax=Lysobacter cavernae TaxID=1685901 RepID=A0ABV7RSN2_9GAMM